MVDKGAQGMTRREMEPNRTALNHHLATAHALADRARRIARRGFRTMLAVEHKDDASPVSRIDRAVEATCRAELARRHPAHGIVGEEYGAERADAEWVWVIDPIDGTRAYLSGVPTWSTLIALLHHGQPVLGLIDAGATGERWAALRGLGAWAQASRRSARPCSTSGCASLGAARVATGVPRDLHGPMASACRQLGAEALNHAWMGDGYAYGLLASGHLDLVIESGLGAYDFLAPAVVVEAAGGTITDAAGRPLGLHSDGCVVAAATAGLHAQALRRMPQSNA